MPQVCPRCKAPVNGKSVRCPECGTSLGAATAATNGRSQPRAVTPPAPSAPLLFTDQAAHTAPPVESAPSPAPIFEGPSEPGKRAVIPPPRPAAPPPVPPPVVQSTPAPAPIEPVEVSLEVPSALEMPQPVDASTLAAQGLYETAEDVQGWMTRMLSGTTDEFPPFAQPAADPPLGRESKYLPPPDPPMIFYPMLADPDEDWSDDAFPPLPSVLAPSVSLASSTDGSASGLATLAALEVASELLAEPEPAENETPVAPPLARLEVLDSLGEWVDWGPVPADGRVIGRAENFPGGETLAVEHLQLRYEDTTLVADDLDSCDGIYRRLVEPLSLTDGQRFRIGGHVLEFRSAERFQPVSPLVSDERGTLCSRDLEPLAYVDLIRPNGQPGLRFPLTKRDATVIGREGPMACIALPDDPSLSTSHAQIRPRDGGFLLEDLKSRGGTFVQLQGTTPLCTGDVLQAGRLTFRVAEA